MKREVELLEIPAIQNPSFSIKIEKIFLSA